MFTESASARFYLRASVATVIAVVAAASTIWIDNPYIKLASAGLIVLGGYLGVGAASPQMEPFVGNKLPNAEVPVPPATPEN